MSLRDQLFASNSHLPKHCFAIYKFATSTRRMGGVSDGDRTHDHRNHNPALYQLSYAHHKGDANSNVFEVGMTMLLNRGMFTNLYSKFQANLGR